MAKGRQGGRQPFDPKKVKAPLNTSSLFASQGPAQPSVLTVTALNHLVRAAITKEMSGTLHVVGELSNLSRPSGGHVYFTMKDDESEVRCVMWQSAVATLKFQPLDGLAVIATGTIDVYEPRGQVQFYVRKLEPRGVGSLELAFRQLRDRLQKEGLFDTARKRKLPRFPARIAIVTSPTSAALHDILQTLQRRFPCVMVYFFPVKVQGDGAATEIADAIHRLNAAGTSLGGIDVMIVGRGGGSLEDLRAFNEEAVARAIYASNIPIVSAVGHEVDVTIADFVADVRAATPTAAAELVAPQRSDVLLELDGRRHRLLRAFLRSLESAKNRVALVQRYDWFRDPLGRIRERQQVIDEAGSRLRLVASRLAASQRNLLHERVVRLTAISPQRRIERQTLQLGQLAARLGRDVRRGLEQRARTLATLNDRLKANSHETVLKRGFTITRKKKSGKIVTKSDEVRTGDDLVTQTSAGEIASRVIDRRQGELFEGQS